MQIIKLVGASMAIIGFAAAVQTMKTTTQGSGDPNSQGSYCDAQWEEPWNTYNVAIWSDTQESSKLCGGLWDNLKTFSGCGIKYDASCEDQSASKEHPVTVWNFRTGVTCNAGMVQSAIWHSTKPHQSGIRCKSK